MPGHKGGRGAPAEGRALFGEQAYAADVSEMGGFDYLHGSSGPLARAEAQAASLFGASRSWFLVNGATVGNLAAICALVPEGAGLLLARNAHRSVYAGLALCGARPYYLTPLRDEQADGFFAIDLDEIETQLHAHPDIAAVHLTSPSYYGLCVDLDKAASVCAAHHVPLIVDEAHGTHFHFHPAFPAPALRVGADVVVHSPHKTLGSLTQSSLLHAQGDRVDCDRVSAYLQMLQSSSPSALLSVSLDVCLAEMRARGGTLWQEALDLANLTRRALAQRDVHVIGRASLPEGVVDFDPTKLVVDVSALGWSGPSAARWLAAACKVNPEFSDARRLVFLLGYADDQAAIELLVEALSALAVARAAEPDRPVETLSALWPTRLPGYARSPREALGLPTEVVGLEQAEGRVAAEMVVPYPPGIPILVPGEVVDAEVLGLISLLHSVGARIVGMADSTGRSLRCLC